MEVFGFGLGENAGNGVEHGVRDNAPNRKW
jgi:hypothetical protein